VKVVSGRSYRLQTFTDEELYARYFDHCWKRNAPPLSKTTLFYKYLAKEKIHHNRDATFCKYCAKLEGNTNVELDDDERAELEGHRQRWYDQTSAYLAEKLRITLGENPMDFLIIQDFTQLEVQNIFYQDLIIVIYQYSDKGNGAINTKSSANPSKRTILHLSLPPGSNSPEREFSMDAPKSPFTLMAAQNISKSHHA